MKAGAIVALIFGILFLIGGIILLGLYGLGASNSKQELDETVPAQQFWAMGDKPASRIIAEYKAEYPVDVYVTTDSSVKSGFVFSINSLDDVKLLEEGKTSGKIDYDTPDDSKTYYILFYNKGNYNNKMHVDIEFQFEAMNYMCLIPGVIGLILGPILILVGYRIHKKSKGDFVPGAQPPGYQQTPGGYQQYPQYGEQGMQRTCKACGRPVGPTDKHCQHCGWML